MDVESRTEACIAGILSVCLILMALDLWKISNDYTEILLSYRAVAEQADLWKIRGSKRPRYAAVIVRDLVPTPIEARVNVVPSSTKKKHVYRKAISRVRDGRVSTYQTKPHLKSRP